MVVIESDAYHLYNDYLDGLYPLDGISCNPFRCCLKRETMQLMK